MRTLSTSRMHQPPRAVLHSVTEVATCGPMLGAVRRCEMVGRSRFENRYTFDRTGRGEGTVM